MPSSPTTAPISLGGRAVLETRRLSRQASLTTSVLDSLRIGLPSFYRHLIRPGAREEEGREAVNFESSRAAARGIASALEGVRVAELQHMADGDRVYDAASDRDGTLLSCKGGSRLRLSDGESTWWTDGADGFSLEEEPTEGGRVRTPGYLLPSGELLELPGARWIRADWMADPEKYADNLTMCSTAAMVMRDGEGRPMSVPLGCGMSLCPTCMRRKAGQRVKRCAPLIERLSAVGCPVVHVTLTAPPSEDPDKRAPVADLLPGTWSPLPRGHWDPGSVQAVAGEQLGHAMERVTGAFRSMREDRSSRSWWRSEIIGALTGFEVTGHRPVAMEGGGRLRWHAHVHAVLVLRPGALDRARLHHEPGRTTVEGGSWWNRLLSEWCRRTGADPAGQSCTVVLDAAAGCAEVLKYPFKPGELTRSQVLEALTTLKGRKLHTSVGCFHHHSRWRKMARGESPLPPDGADRWVVGALRGDPLPAHCHHERRPERPSSPLLVWRESDQGDAPLRAMDEVVRAYIHAPPPVPGSVGSWRAVMVRDVVTWTEAACQVRVGWWEGDEWCTALLGADLLLECVAVPPDTAPAVLWREPPPDDVCYGHRVGHYCETHPQRQPELVCPELGSPGAELELTPRLVLEDSLCRVLPESCLGYWPRGR